MMQIICLKILSDFELSDKEKFKPITVHNVAWEDIGALQHVRDELTL